MAENLGLPEGFRVVSVPRVYNTGGASLPEGFRVVQEGEKTQNIQQPKQPALKPLTAEQRAEAAQMAKGLRPKKTLGDYFADNMADIAFGAKKALSGATLGGSDWLGKKLGFDVSDDTYLSQKDAEGVGNVARTAGFASELGGNLLGAGGALAKGLSKAGLKGLKLASTAGGLEGMAYGATGSNNLGDLPRNVLLGGVAGAALPVGLNYGLKPFVWATKPLTNRLSQYLGKRNLTKQLERGNNFEDISLGNMDDDLVNEVNRIRNAENVSPFENSKVLVPADRVEHIRQGRIVNNNYTPQKTVDVIDNALFKKGNIVGRGNIPESQIIYDNRNPANKIVVGKNNKNNGISIITAMKDKSLGKKNKRLGGLPFPPYEANSLKGISTAAGSNIPDVQPLSQNIARNIENVNPAFKRSFVEALADEGKRKTMRNAVKSGAEDLSERAKILSDQLERRKNGMFDPDFENLIKTPELRKAEESYSKFMNTNSSKVMPKEKVLDFYNQHPIAKNMIEEMRTIDPRAFDGIQPGSLAEFDMLKKTLREEAGNKIGVGASKSGALKRAENSLKSLMDNEFPGFKDINKNFANAKTTQDIFESKLKKGLTSVGGETTSPFWSGISSPLTAAGVVGGYFNPAPLTLTVAGLGGKALMRSLRRNAGRRLADGIIKTPVDVNPVFSAGLSATALSNLRKDWK